MRSLKSQPNTTRNVTHTHEKTTQCGRDEQKLPHPPVCLFLSSESPPCDSELPRSLLNFFQKSKPRKTRIEAKRATKKSKMFPKRLKNDLKDNRNHFENRNIQLQKCLITTNANTHTKKKSDLKRTKLMEKRTNLTTLEPLQNDTK